MKVFTIRNYPGHASYGFETTQAYRHKLLDRAGIPNCFVVATPQMETRWIDKFPWIDFNLNDVVVLPHLFTDLPDRPFGVAIEKALEEWPDAIVATQTEDHALCLNGNGYLDLIKKDGLVVSGIERDETQKVVKQTNFTTGKFLTLSVEESEIVYYHSDGSIACRCEINADKKQYDESHFLYHAEGCTYTTRDLVQRYVEEHAAPDDVVIVDQSQVCFGLESIGRENHLQIWPYVHFNIADAQAHGDIPDGATPDEARKELRFPRRCFIASPYAIDYAKEAFNMDATFMPPVGVRVADALPAGLSGTRFCLISHLGEHKRIPLALDAFRRLPPSIELDIYGGSDQAIEEFASEHAVPSNVHMLGARKSEQVPRESYLGYVSCSKSEMYANAMVEACAVGLIPIVSDVNYGHRQYVEEIGCNTGFSDADELARKIRMVVSWDREMRVRWSRRVLDWVRKFSSENVDKVILGALQKASQATDYL